MKSIMGKTSSLGKSTKKKGLKSSKKSLNKVQISDCDNVDSLSCLKQKKIENIDDKFLKLKSELHSLFVNPKAEISNSLSKKQAKTHETQECDKLKTKNDLAIILSPKPSKFSKWLDETIDKIDVESSNSNISENSNCNKSLPSTAELKTKSMYDMTLLPDYKVEQLLYKSFNLQKLGIYVISSSDESEDEEFKSKDIVKKEKKRYKKARRNIYSSSFPRRNFKKQKDPLDSDVEVINVESSFEKDIHFVDLVVDDYDWDEPFFTKNKTDCSDLEIIEYSQNDKGSNKKQQNKQETSYIKNVLSTSGQEQSNAFSSPAVKRTWECPICFETSHGQSIVATLCGHIFCKGCLEKHNSTYEKHCPTCRFDLRDKAPITLFNL